MSTDNTRDKVLTHLIEECSEVIQEACKIYRFGLHSYHPDEPEKTNRMRLREELIDLQAMIDITLAEIVVYEPNDVLTEDEIEAIVTKKYNAILN